MRKFSGALIHGVAVRNEVVHETAGGLRFQVTHGDEFDCVVQKNMWLARLGSLAYDLLLEINTLYNFLRRKAGLEYRSLSAQLKNRVKKVVNFVSRYEETVVSEALKRNVDGFICGHIHQPASKNFSGIMYKNIGDWVESCSALTERFDGSLHIIHWKGGMSHNAISPIAFESSYATERLMQAG